MIFSAVVTLRQQSNKKPGLSPSLVISTTSNTKVIICLQVTAFYYGYVSLVSVLSVVRGRFYYKET